MLKAKVLKVIFEDISPCDKPFLMEGESTPYRIKRDGRVERFLKSIWVDSSYSYLDFIAIYDAGRIKECTQSCIEFVGGEKVEKVKRTRK